MLTRSSDERGTFPDARPRSPFALAVSILAGFFNRRQQEAIDYLREENRVLREMLGHRRLRFTETQRKRLAIRGKILGRALLRGIATLVEPDTILDWHRRLVAKKWTYAAGSLGKATAMKATTQHVVRMARENPTWGYDRLQGALKMLGHLVCPNTIKAILPRNGITPAPDRGRRTPWKAFLKAHAKSIFAADFFSTEVWTARGLVHALHTLRASSCHACRAHRRNDAPSQRAFHGPSRQAHHRPRRRDPPSRTIPDHRRDSKFTATFRRVLADAGVRVLITPASAPNCNAYAERFVRSIKEECLNRMIFFGTDALLRALREYEAHFLAERPHQGDRQLDHRARTRRTCTPRRRSTSRETRRAPLVLLPRRGLTARPDQSAVFVTPTAGGALRAPERTGCGRCHHDGTLPNLFSPSARWRDAPYGLLSYYYRSAACHGQTRPERPVVTFHPRAELCQFPHRIRCGRSRHPRATRPFARSVGALHPTRAA